jgi:anti-sigma factor RsiW
MTAETDIPDEAELHAHADGRLDPAAAARVARYLAAHPEAARRLADWRRDSEALRQALAPEAALPIPDRLRIDALLATRAARRREAWAAWRQPAAAALALLLGGGAGWMARGAAQPARMDAMVQEAMAAHSVFAASPGPPRDPAAMLAAWSTAALGHAVTAPDLSASGYRLVGAHAVPTGHGPGCVFIYADAAGHRISLFVRPMRDIDRTLPMRRVQGPDCEGFVWAHHGRSMSLGYGVMAEPGTGSLRAITDAVRDQLI